MEFGRCWVAVPLDMTDDRRRKLIPFCKAALDKFNADNRVLQLNNNSSTTTINIIN
jgi:uncharacterized membrane protein